MRAIYELITDDPILSALVKIAGAGSLALLALLLLTRWRGNVLSKGWLRSLLAKPLYVAPGLYRRFIFLGYEKRLADRLSRERRPGNYFGLPADDSEGEIVLPDETGDSLHRRIAEAAGPQSPVLIVGSGGAGKSTLLARIAELSLAGAGPFAGWRPLWVPAADYTDSLTKAIAETLRARDHVPVTDDSVKAQMQTGRFLILFDGVSEIAGDRTKALAEILRTARDADYEDCRFVIATRPIEAVTPGTRTITLRPITPNLIRNLLPRYGLNTAQANVVERQLALFRGRPIEPQLLWMIIKDAGQENLAARRSQVFENYFKHLLRETRTVWAAWLRALETLAFHFCLSTGLKGAGMPHKPLLDALEQTGGSTRPLHAELRRLYRLPVDHDNLSLLDQLKASGLLASEPRWVFTHDSFEEYFAASYLVSYFEEHTSWPPLEKWRERGDLRRDFLDILAFVREIASARSVPSGAMSALSPEVISAIRVSPVQLVIVLAQKGMYGPEFDGPIFNVDCDVVNPGAQTERVHLLEAHLTGADGVLFVLQWSVFYETRGLVHRMTSHAGPFDVPGGKTRFGIQFVGPPTARWSAGRYALRLAGWLAAHQGRDEPSFVETWEMTVTPLDQMWLARWGNASEEDWAAQDDRAVGIPVKLSRPATAAPTL